MKSRRLIEAAARQALVFIDSFGHTRYTFSRGFLTGDGKFMQVAHGQFPNIQYPNKEQFVSLHRVGFKLYFSSTIRKLTTAQQRALRNFGIEENVQIIDNADRVAFDPKSFFE